MQWTGGPRPQLGGIFLFRHLGHIRFPVPLSSPLQQLLPSQLQGTAICRIASLEVLRLLLLKLNILGAVLVDSGPYGGHLFVINFRPTIELLMYALHGLDLDTVDLIAMGIVGRILQQVSLGLDHLGQRHKEEHDLEQHHLDAAEEDLVHCGLLVAHHPADDYGQHADVQHRQSSQDVVR
jgi:hypothetical protein